MAALMDTHVVLWFLSGDKRLSGSALKIIQSEEEIYFSPVSLWEIGIKLGLGRSGFVLAEDWWRTIPRGLTNQRINRLEVMPEDYREVARLPLHHRDPFDRMLIVQASNNNCSIISADRQLNKYKVKVMW